jgi:hypothetical protein
MSIIQKLGEILRKAMKDPELKVEYTDRIRSNIREEP